jgi:hypothetical protein
MAYAIQFRDAYLYELVVSKELCSRALDIITAIKKKKYVLEMTTTANTPRDEDVINTVRYIAVKLPNYEGKIINNLKQLEDWGKENYQKMLTSDYERRHFDRSDSRRFDKDYMKALADEFVAKDLIDLTKQAVNQNNQDNKDNKDKKESSVEIILE